MIELIKSATVKLGLSLHVIGLMNIQFAIKGKEIYILEAIQEHRELFLCFKSYWSSIAKIAVENVGKKINDTDGLIKKIKTIIQLKRQYFLLLNFLG